MDIKNLRKDIDSIDKEMALLFNKRLDLSIKISEYKKENNIQVLDKNREEEVINKNLEYIENDEYKEYYKEFIITNMNISKKLQNRRLDNLNRISVNSIKGTYEIIIKRNSLKDLNTFVNLDRKVLIVSDDNIPSEYIDIVSKQIKEPLVFRFKEGEESKSIDTLKSILDLLTDKCFSRSDLVIALGGGVSGDIAGFSASIYNRGIDFINIPTSLLSMLDSSIGGKTAINYQGIKNIVGSFYSPSFVLIDPDLLKTLDNKEFNSGLAEAIKMATTLSKDLFEFIESSNDIYKDIDRIIYESLLIKRSIIELDEHENNIRKVLNFGHTIGHAIEALSNGFIRHGEAVSIGMTYMVSSSIKDRLINLLNKYDLPTKTSYLTNDLIDIIKHDKKIINDKIDIIISKKIGTYSIKNINIDELMEVLKDEHIW